MKIVAMVAAVAAATKIKNLPLSTSGSQIIDSQGNTV
jgi:hypothetical protein